VNESTHPARAWLGEWRGRNQLVLSPDDPARESDTVASVRLELHHRVVSFRYTWSDNGAPQEGWLLVQHDTGTGGATVAWTDTWHMAHAFMHLVGTLDLRGRLDVLGSYAAPPGPDWGWRIAIAADTAGRLNLQMFNITPEGQSFLAVDAAYHR
jgi:hypothetical protein